MAAPEAVKSSKKKRKAHHLSDQGSRKNSQDPNVVVDERAEAEEAARLERLLFGGKEEDLNEFGQEEAQVLGWQPQVKSDAGWIADLVRRESQAPGETSRQPEGKESPSGSETEAAPAKRGPAWVDEADKEATVNIARVNRLRKLRTVEEEAVVSGEEYAARLRAQHAKLNRGTDWARLPEKIKGLSKDDDDDDHERLGVLLDQQELVVRSKGLLPPNQLEATRMRDANAEEPCKGVVRTVNFHPNGQLLLTASLDKHLRFFNVDGKNNPKVQGVFLEDTPVHQAGFTGDGAKVVAAGRRKWFYVYDIAAARVDKVNSVVGREERSLEQFALSPDGQLAAFVGNEGHCLLLSLRTKQWVGTLKMNGTLRALAFSSDSKTLLTTGGDGEVYHWDVGSRRCLFRTRDEGCVKGSAIDVSRDGRLFATGSDSGVVNLYDRGALKAGVSAPQPLKSVMNLTTTIDTVQFNPDGQILAMASRMKKDSLRLLHVPSLTVFSNWPTGRTPLNYVHCLDFSPGGGFLAIGNAKGRVLLYRLHHYDQA